MRIGLDFDNTIADYTESFRTAAATRFDMACANLSKTEIRDTLRAGHPDGDRAWMTLQGEVYGPRMAAAQPMPGLFDFLAFARDWGTELWIISHKTEFAHIDPTRTPLRTAALDWMLQTGIHEYVSAENVIFAADRPAKLKAIGRLAPDAFVDDLVEVLDDPSFPDDVMKVLFAPERGLGWPSVQRRIFDGVPKRQAFVTATGIDASQIVPVHGGGNNRLYRVRDENKTEWLYKAYIHDDTETGRADSETRQMREVFALTALAEIAPDMVPALKARVHLSDAVGTVQTFIDGTPPVSVSEVDLRALATFIARLFAASPQWINHPDCPSAKEACISVRDIDRQIKARLIALQQVDAPILREFLIEAEKFYSSLKQFNEIRIPACVLSPSDLGFHNMIARKENDPVWIDFEYFGRDDPAKLICDLLLHPAMTKSVVPNAPQALCDRKKALLYAEICYALNSVWPEIEVDSLIRRIRTLMPRYVLRWALIVLNPFLPVHASRQRHLNDLQILKLRLERHRRAHAYLDMIASETWQAWLVSNR